MIPLPSWRTLTIILIVLAYVGMFVGEDSVIVAAGIIATATFAAHLVSRNAR